MVMTNFPSFSLASASSPDFSLGIEPYEPSYIPSMAEPTDWRAVASQVAQSYNLRPDVLTNMIQAESNFNPYAVSPKGAKGLLQFMPETAAEYGLTDPFDGYANIDAGARYLRKNLDMFGGDYIKAVAAHNAGPGAVQKYGGVPDYPETQNYVSSVMKGIDLNTPLPEAPKLEVGTSPSQYTSVQLRSAATPSMSQTRAEDLYRTQKEISALEESKAQALQEMGKQGYMTGQESLAMALTALLPTLIGWGARGNLEGAAGGAQAGALGAGIGFQGIQNEIKRRDDLSREVYQNINQQLARKEAEAYNMTKAFGEREEKIQDLLFTEEGKDRRSGQMANALKRPDEGGVLLSPEVSKSIQGKASIAAAGKDVLDFVANKTPELMKEQYRKPNGEIDWSGAGEILLSRFKDVAGPETDIGAVRQKINQFLSTYQKEMSGLAATDKEFARLRAQLYEGGFLNGQVLPTSIPKAMEVIQEFINKQRILAKNDVQIQRALRSGTEESIDQLFDQYQTSPGAGITPTLGKYKIGDTVQKEVDGRIVTFIRGAEGWEEQ